MTRPVYRAAPLRPTAFAGLSYHRYHEDNLVTAKLHTAPGVMPTGATSHLGWPADLTYATFAQAAVGIVEAYLDGKYTGAVNPDALQHRKGRS